MKLIPVVYDLPAKDPKERDIYIEKRGTGWVVLDCGLVLRKSTRAFDYDHMPSNRTDEWRADTMFSTALEAYQFYLECKS